METKAVGRIVFVAVGSFNPAILAPEWFERHSLVPAEETAALFAEPIEKTLPEIGLKIQSGAQFFVEPTQALINFKSFVLSVNREKFEIRCEDTDKIPLIEEFITKFFLLLAETPVSAYGLNYMEHLSGTSDASEILNKLFNKTKFTSEIFGDDISCGHKIISMVDSMKLQLAIEASPIIPGGIYLKTNYHYDNESSESKELVKTLKKNVEVSLENTEQIILKLCGENPKRHSGRLV